MIDFFSNTINFFSSIISEVGYVGIFLGMTIESSFFPFPSEIILIPAGTLVAKGQMNFFFVFIASILGSLLGATINFFLAFYLGRNTIDKIISKYGRFLFITKRTLGKTDDYFNKHGEITTFIGRLIPGIRQLISLPAGFSRMNFPRFVLFTSLGAGIWGAFLIYIGYLFGQNYLIMENLNNIYLLFLLFSLIIIIIYILKKKH